MTLLNKLQGGGGVKKKYKKSKYTFHEITIIIIKLTTNNEPEI